VTPTAAARSGKDVAADLAFLTRALKAPALRDSAGRLAERAHAEGWSHEEFLIACLQREVAARDAHGGEGRIRAARFPGRKTLEEFNFDHARGLKRDVILHLGTLDFVTAKENVIFLGPPGTGKTHLATGLGIRACQAGHRVLFATASQWVDRLAEAHNAGRLQAELIRLARYPLLVVDLCRHRDYAEAMAFGAGPALGGGRCGYCWSRHSCSPVERLSRGMVPQTEAGRCQGRDASRDCWARMWRAIWPG
jgi:hypothetical protein